MVIVQTLVQTESRVDGGINKVVNEPMIGVSVGGRNMGPRKTPANSNNSV